MTDISILYIGSLNKQSNSFRRFEALSNLSYRIKGLNSDPFILAKYLSGIQHYYNVGPGIILLNRRIREIVRIRDFDVVWVDNKTFLSSKTIQYIRKANPKARIINLLTDDPFGKYKSSWQLLKETAAMYDVFFVQRQENLRELKQIGARQVEICYRSYAPDYNRPMHLNETDAKQYKTSVGFIGSYEADRASHIAYLINNGIPVSVTGDGWIEQEHWKDIEPFYRGPSVYGDAYIKSICGMDIALHFLRKGNRDKQDSRTFEIPSCRAFMLAEFSEVHATLFDENKEAVYFKTKEELLQKVRHYLVAPEDRMRIAQNGFSRCVMSGYSHEKVLGKALAYALKIGNEA